MLFENFRLAHMQLNEIQVRVRIGGNGPPLLLLHGHPQTHMMWNRIAPKLAQNFTVVMPDLRGYGDSSKPKTAPDHSPYSKRTMAKDQIELMEQLGFHQFAVVGHDRGARCAYRLALDFPEAVTKLAVLDIIPTGEAFRRISVDFALDTWHWFFLAQPYDLPERMIGENPDHFYFRSSRDLFHPEALEDYVRCIQNPKTIHAMCEDYRAGVFFDRLIDDADRGMKKISCPVLALWSTQGELPRLYDVLAVWRDWADDVQGRGIDCGHFLAEEAPEETYEEIFRFFQSV
ncbi:alpha/beta fold hydrolase [Planococcus sp. YIM B11945]|uniref:alpha/beta fold hydrolase n=1 Tax=Planococcus sp. YIM B11945 TaxID=3435410 RepID=UPI003D7EAB43